MRKAELKIPRIISQKFTGALKKNLDHLRKGCSLSIPVKLSINDFKDLSNFEEIRDNLDWVLSNSFRNTVFLELTEKLNSAGSYTPIGQRIVIKVNPDSVWNYNIFNTLNHEIRHFLQHIMTVSIKAKQNRLVTVRDTDMKQYGMPKKTIKTPEISQAMDSEDSKGKFHAMDDVEFKTNMGNIIDEIKRAMMQDFMGLNQEEKKKRFIDILDKNERLYNLSRRLSPEKKRNMLSELSKLIYWKPTKEDKDVLGQKTLALFKSSVISTMKSKIEGWVDQKNEDAKSEGIITQEWQDYSNAWKTFFIRENLRSNYDYRNIVNYATSHGLETYLKKVISEIVSSLMRYRTSTTGHGFDAKDKYSNEQIQDSIKKLQEEIERDAEFIKEFELEGVYNMKVDQLKDVLSKKKVELIQRKKEYAQERIDRQRRDRWVNSGK